MKPAYFIANSPHYLPTVLPLITETGGTLISFNRRTGRFLPKEIGRSFTIRFFQNYKSLLRHFKELSVDVVVHPSFSIQYFKGRTDVRHVQIFHGTSDKPFNFHPSLARYDLITVPGPKMKEDIVKKGLSPAERISVVGYPKIDAFLHSDFDPGSFRKEIGLDPGKKTILYSPTWDDPDHYSSFARFVVPVLRECTGYNVILKPHPNTLRYRPWHIARAYIAKGENSFIFLKTRSILPFMAVSDILLTDISSVSHEYLPFNRPMVFLNPQQGRPIPNEHTWIWHCGDVVSEVKDLRWVLRENIGNPDRYNKERDAARKRVFLDFDGKSAFRFKNALIGTMEKTG